MLQIVAIVVASVAIVVVVEDDDDNDSDNDYVGEMLVVLCVLLLYNLILNTHVPHRNTYMGVIRQKLDM